MRLLVFSAAMAVICLSGRSAPAQDKPAASAPDKPKEDVNPDEIIRKFAAKEAEFKEARGNYTYRQTVKMEELDPPPTGKWEEVDDIIFNGAGKRSEVVVRAPVPNLQHLTLTPEDSQDLRDVQPFVLTSADINLYNVNYVGREKVDEIGCFTFSVKPKKMEKGKRYFEGQIWVDDRDYQIVKTYGKGVGLVSKSNQFPKFETYREQIDGKYWFPTYTHADDTLHFPGGENVHIRMTVQYQDYKKFEGRSTITYGKPVEDTPPPPKKKQ
jgi:hypothetical protein